jgi:hypothetical protein
MHGRRRLRGKREWPWKRVGWGTVGRGCAGDGCAREDTHGGGRIRRFLVRLDGGGRRDGIFIFILQTFLETVDTLEQGFEDVCFGAAFFGDGIYDNLVGYMTGTGV